MKSLLKSIFLLPILNTLLFACITTHTETFLKNEYYNFTDPDMVDLPRDNPLYKLSGTYAAHDARFKYFEQKKKDLNLKAWQSYFNKEYSLKELEAIFYKKESLKKSAKYFKNSKTYPNFGRYINFLYLQNNLAQNRVEKNSHEIIAQGLKLFKQEDQPFLKERYLYLLLRLYHHTGEYHQLLDLYASNILIINQYGIVKEWITALVAGAYQHLQQNLKANQLYAQIFANHKTNPHYGYYDFKIHSNKEWEALLASTQEPDTQALYYFLRAMKWENEPLYELKSIAQIAPNSIWFERLSYMIMQELQYKRHSLMVHRGKKDKYFYTKLKSYKLQKKYFLEIISTIKKQTFFTLYARLYLNVLDFNSLQRKELVQLRSLANHKQKPYARLLTYIYGLHQLPSSSKQEQHALYLQLKPLLPKFSAKKQASILKYTILHLSILDDTQSIEKKLNRLFSQNQTQRCNILKALNYASAKKFQTYVESPKETFFEKIVFKMTMKNLHRGDVAKILGTLYLQQNNFAKSQFYLRQVPKKNLFNLYNPFNANIDGSNRQKSKTTYSQREFVETMLRIQRALEENPHSPQEHFLYANALYNKSWFGNFPLSSVLYRSPILKRDLPPPKTTDLTQAQKEYELALQYSTDEEFKAKVTYQLLKIKFNRALLNSENYDKDMHQMPHFSIEGEGTQNVIKLLQRSKDFQEAISDFRAEYGHTNYAKEVIKRCVTFKYF